MPCRACTAGACAVPRQSLVFAPSLPSRHATRPHAMKFLSNHTVKRADRPTEVGGGWKKETTRSLVSLFNNIYILLGQSQRDLHKEDAAAAGALRIFSIPATGAAAAPWKAAGQSAMRQQPRRSPL